MQLICYSILICSIFHLNWRVAHLIQFDVTCKVGLTMQKMASETGRNERQQYIFSLIEMYEYYNHGQKCWDNLGKLMLSNKQ